MGDPTRVTNIGYALSNMSKQKGDKIKSAAECETDLIAQIVRSGQSDHHSQIPGGNRKERRLLARKVRAAKKEIEHD